MKRKHRQEREEETYTPSFPAGIAIVESGLLIDENGNPFWVDVDDRTIEAAEVDYEV